MLKRLELIGFKSFADKTRFDFAPGVTAVVGPNGSGKSNVVDAVKWVLGEQSAKSLRGGEMVDVIFNGSSTRKSLGMAEVTMTFDNTRRLLSLDGDEVQITRRVYRDGQSEYLINGQMARLKDIRELFLGSGAGHGAYSVIEQGRVDALLMASTKDRRIIFEEAAGISRFRSRKLETLRKLERVEADLQRVRDILQELDKRLRTLRLQAAKAQRYVEYTDRLKSLRIGLGRRDYQDLTETLTRESDKLASLQTEARVAAAGAHTGEARLGELDIALAHSDDDLRKQEARAAAARQQIATQDAAIKYERGQTTGLETELLRLGQQRADLGTRLRVVEADLARTVADLTQVTITTATEQAATDAATAALAAVSARIAELTRQTQADRDVQFQLVGRVARLQSDSHTLRAECDRLTREQARKLAEAERTARQHDALGTMLADLSRTDADLREKLDGAKQNHADHITNRDALRQQADALQLDLESKRQARSDLLGRADILDGLERSFEGIGAGVRHILDRLAKNDPALTSIAGLVANFLTAPRDVAALIDLALGDAAQRFVVMNADDIPTLAATLGELPGRVGFVPLNTNDVKSHNPVADASGSFGLRASTLVHVERADLASLPHRLLGNVIVVDDLATAREHASTTPGFRYISRRGELLEPDGTLTVGPTQSGTDILSRKAELRDLGERITMLDREIETRETEQAAHRRQADALGPHIRALETEITALGGEAGTLRDRIREQRQIHEQQTGLLDLLRQEASTLETEAGRSRAAWESTSRDAENAERDERALREKLAHADTELTECQLERESRQDAHLAAQLALSRVKDQLSGLQQRQVYLDTELRQRRIDAVNLSSMERSARGKLTDSTLAMLRASAIAAEAYGQKEESERAAAAATSQRNAIRESRDSLQSSLRELRETATRHNDRAHAHELLVRDLTNRRESLLARLREDYGIDLSVMTDAAGTDAGPVPLTPAINLDPEDVQAEIDDLKRKIAKLGSVNLEALDELADIEKREGDLKSQHDDLTEGQKKLLDIINQINADSRRLFLDLMTTVRGHFLELFRKLFGGGTADVVLEDESDPLESGIDVTARPPGKELRSISLLSGGERTLTAIALLLAIFRSRPSPFCLLDEVDAALDEANTARLSAALREFLDRSQFIIITHKKRTMAMADMLYGITMQESGISKQVVVKFEDWPEDEPAPPTPTTA